MDEPDQTPDPQTRLERIRSEIMDERASIVSEISSLLTEKLSEELSESLSGALSKQLLASLTKSLAADIENAIFKAFHGINSKIENLESTIQVNSNELCSIKSKLNELENVVIKQQDEIEQLRCTNANLTEQIPASVSENITERLAEVEELVEERTNRQMRETLVFRGLEEQPRETWSDTKHSLSEIISETCGVTYEDAALSINRCHRSASRMTKDGRKIKSRPIYANFYEWEITENIISCFRESNILYPHFNIKADYKYGPLTTKRRNEALKVRWQLKSDKKISKGFIQYPAKLLVMYIGETDYKVHHDFSKMRFPRANDRHV